MTRAPSARWTAQQLRNVTPLGTGAEIIIRERDDKYGTEFDEVAKGASIRVLRTAVQAPLMNAACERILGSVRRECLDHINILGESHLRAVLTETVAYFNRLRPHQRLKQRVPVPPGEAASAGKTVALPVLGRLHHDYRQAARRDGYTRGPAQGPKPLNPPRSATRVP
ncbi:MAG: transposase [Polyangiaceae bacterium]|nr:transposase [Polyangiaceae bacterium]